MSLGTTPEQVAYNQAAIAHAAALHRYRGEQTKPAQPSDSLAALLPSHDKTALGVALEFERMGRQHLSDELAERAAQHGATLAHLGLTIGTIVHGVDVRRAGHDDELTRFLRDVLLERKVIFFRDQHLDEDEQTAFGRCFGDLDAFPFGKPGDNPFVLELVHGEGRPGYENGWHTDVTWMERPSLGSIAQMIVAPPIGGDTLFADSHAAYLGLPPDIQEQIEHLDGINDYRIFLRGRGESAMPDELVDAITADIPFGVAHPLVRTHPETGKRALYIHGGFLRHESLFDRRTGEPIGEDASRRIVRQLLAQHPRPEFWCRFRWTEGSIAFWDNRAVQHYAASDYYPHDRVLRRVTVAGDRPT